MPAISLGSDSARISLAERPFFCTVAARYSPLALEIFSSEVTGDSGFAGEGLGCGSGHAVFVRQFSAMDR